MSCPTLCNSVDWSPPCSSVHGILQARMEEWVAISFSRDLVNPGIKPLSPAFQEDSLLLSHQRSLTNSRSTLKKLLTMLKKKQIHTVFVLITQEITTVIKSETFSSALLNWLILWQMRKVLCVPECNNLLFFLKDEILPCSVEIPSLEQTYGHLQF